MRVRLAFRTLRRSPWYAATDVLVPRTPSPPTSQGRWSRSLDAVARLDDRISADEPRLRLSAALAARVNEYPARQVRPGPYVAVSMRPLEVYLGRSTLQR